MTPKQRASYIDLHELDDEKKSGKTTMVATATPKPDTTYRYLGD